MATVKYGSLEEGRPYAADAIGDPATERAAVINLVSLFTGTGMLSLPYAAARAGWLGGIVILAGVQGTFMYTLYILALSFDASGANSFAELGEVALNARRLITFSVFVEMMLALTSLEVSIALNCYSVFAAAPALLWLILSTLISLSLSLSKRWISAASVIGVSMIIVILAALIVSGSNTHAPEEYKMFDSSGVELSLGLTLFCCGGHAAFSSIYNNMEDKSEATLKRVIYRGAVSLFTIYASIMLLGYFFYGEDTAMPITLNIGSIEWTSRGDSLSQLQSSLEPNDLALLLRTVAAIAIVVNLQVTIPLLVFPLRGLVRYMFLNTENTEENMLNNMFGTCSILIPAGILAEYLSDELAPLCAAIGLMSTTINSVLLPLLFYHCLKGDEAKGDVYFHAFLAALTVLAAVIGLKHI